MNTQTFLNARVSVLVADITQQQVGAIVNAANATLLGGGGVDGAIHRAGGPEILAACQEIRRTQSPDGLPTGEAVITTAGRLAAEYVIHTVGPIKSAEGDRAATLLAACYRNCLALAVQHGLTSLAFPAISTGVYGYPREEAAPIASRTITTFLAHDFSVHSVQLVFFSEQDAEVFMEHQDFSS
jgi:O-acetyl-ADP-ribose deacetylase (regulator of RNase III)